MKPILPREMLWTDLITMDEFFELDPVNEEFFDVLVKMRKEPFALKINEVKVFNEVYYQLTRIVYEHTLPGHLGMFARDIKANLGWSDSAEVVMSMAFFLIMLWDPTKNLINRHFASEIEMKFYSSYYWEPFYIKFLELKDVTHVGYTFTPRPQKIDYFKDKYIDWKTITRDYNLSCIEHVFYLWPEKEEQREIATMINESVRGGLFVSCKLSSEKEQICRFLEKYLGEAADGDMCSESSSPYITERDLREQLDKVERDNNNLRKRIGELEADNARLSTLLEKKKKSTGTARKFTLVEIANYCKKDLTWEVARPVVAMLYKLLRKEGTEEDYVLVDGIDETLMQRRFGDTYINSQTVMPNASSYIAEVKTQKNNYSMTHIGGQEQKRITND